MLTDCKGFCSKFPAYRGNNSWLFLGLRFICWICHYPRRILRDFSSICGSLLPASQTCSMALYVTFAPFFRHCTTCLYLHKSPIIAFCLFTCRIGRRFHLLIRPLGLRMRGLKRATIVRFLMFKLENFRYHLLIIPLN